MEAIYSSQPDFHVVHLVQKLYEVPINPDVLQSVSSVTVVPLISADENPKDITTKDSKNPCVMPTVTLPSQSNTIVMGGPVAHATKTGENTSGLSKESTECQIEKAEISSKSPTHISSSSGTSVLHSPSDFKKAAENCLVITETGEFNLISASCNKSETELPLSDDSDEMWQLPDDICRLCAQRSINLEHIFSDKSKKLGLVEMVHDLLPIFVTSEDLLPLTVCWACISSLQVAHKLVKTCVAADDTLRFLMEHVCKVSLQASNGENFLSDFKSLPSQKKGISDNESSFTASNLGKIHVLDHDYSSQDKTSLSSDSHSSIDSTNEQIPKLNIGVLEDLPSAKQFSFKNNDNSEKIRARGLMVFLVQLPKPNNPLAKAKRARVMEILSKLKAYPTFKRKGKNRMKAFVGTGTLHTRLAAATCEIQSKFRTVFSEEAVIESLGPSPKTNGAVSGEYGEHSERVHTEVDSEDNAESISPTSPSEFNHFDETLSLQLKKNMTESCVENESCNSKIMSIKKAGNIDENVSEVSILHDTAEKNKIKEALVSILNRANQKTAEKGKKKKRKKQLVKPSKLLKCCDCDFVAATIEELGEHKASHLKCKYCGKPHRARNNLIEHERIHTKEKPFVCDHCGLTFRTKAQMLQHAQRHNPETPYECKLCGRKFSVKTTYREHLLRHNEESPFLCDSCGKSFKLQSALRIHKLSHRTFKCSTCDQSFSYKAYRVHQRKHTGQGYNCPECGKMFLSREHMKNHMLIHDGAFPFKCGVCGRSCKRLTQLQTHRRRHAGDLLLRLKYYICAVCNESFDEAVQLARHVRNHTKEELQTTKTLKCSSCDKWFADEHQLRSHELVHTNSKLYSCGTCNQSFSQHEELNNHASDHFEERPHACDACGKRFKSLLSLTSHQPIHQTEKPYSCEQCAKSFKTSNGLTQHKKSHSDVRSFPCNICQLSFKRSDALKNHALTHFTERPYTCSVCNRSFKVRSDCSTHLKRHRLSGLDGTVIQSSYACHVCPLKFTLKVDLTNHVISHHQLENVEASLLNQDDDSHLPEDDNDLALATMF